MVMQELMKAAMQERMREAGHLQMVGEARRAAGASTSGRQEGWTWTVAPGMGEAFASLRGWLLSGADGDTVQCLPGGTGLS